MGLSQKSYTIKNLNKSEMSIYGLPLNEKYVLNSMYEDEYKVRDVLAWDIWTESGSYRNERGLYNTAPMIYTEVFIDDSYEGLYGMQDHVNEYKLDLINKKGTIIKASTNIYPEFEEIKPGQEDVKGIVLKYSSFPDGQKWQNFKEHLMQIVKDKTARHAVKSRNLRKSNLDMIIEIRTKNDEELIHAVRQVDGVESASILKHDGSLRY
ncbi:MAG: hypothetical protein GX345_04785 [Clostridiales bacterium]|nr:hypothetical protein [Clostridiales bacterium]